MKRSIRLAALLLAATTIMTPVCRAESSGILSDALTQYSKFEYTKAIEMLEAFKWFELAAKEGIGSLRDNAASACITLAGRLTPVQVQMASVRVQNWMKTHRADRIH